MPYAAALTEVAKAKEAAQHAVDLLVDRKDAPELHLPIEDLKIAIRFMDLARGGLMAAPQRRSAAGN